MATGSGGIFPPPGCFGGTGTAWFFGPGGFAPARIPGALAPIGPIGGRAPGTIRGAALACEGWVGGFFGPGPGPGGFAP